MEHRTPVEELLDPAASDKRAEANRKSPALAAAFAALGFALEVAMLVALMFWGLQHRSPWKLVLGIGLPAVTMVLWGVFLAPRSERRLKPGAVEWVALVLFLLAALALYTAGSTFWAVLIGIFAVVHFVGSRFLTRPR